MAGRPTKYEPARVDTILKAIREGNTRQSAAALAGVSESTLYQWLESRPEFLESVKKADADAEQAMVATIRRESGKNWTAAAWWLERRRPDEWGRKERVEHSGPDGKDLKIIVEYADGADRPAAPAPAAAGDTE